MEYLFLQVGAVPCSAVYTQLPEQQSEEQREEALLTRSDLWKTLFRGGYMVGKLTRSLSGAHVSCFAKYIPTTFTMTA